MNSNTGLQQEWTTLQNNIERYEHSAQWLKLAALGLTPLAGHLPLWLAPTLLLLLWLQETIFRTSQARLGARIVQIEQLIASAGDNDCQASQLHSQWLAQRPGMLGLLLEYLRSALRPTVAFPYPLLVLLVLLLRS